MKRIYKVHLILIIALLSPLAALAADPTETKVNLNDSKVTKEEKKLDEAQTQKANRFARRQAEVINKVPGVQVSTEDLKENPKKKGISINPVRWVFGPVIKLQEQTVRLQQQMMKLTGPIAALQPAMLNLQQRVERMGGQMKAVQNELSDVKNQMHTISGRLDQTVTHMKGVDKNIGNVSKQMTSVQSSLSGTYRELKSMRPDLSNVRSDISKIREPITKIQEPLISMADPIHNLDKQVTGVHDDISRIREPLVRIEQPITSLEKQLTGLTSDISDLRNLLSMVLTSIFIAAIMIAVGTPIAGILIWRNKNKILPGPKPGESSEDELTRTERRQPTSTRR